MDLKTAATLLVTIGLAVAGYLFTYWYNVRLSRRRDRLDRVSRQLSDLYGPLFALVTSSTSIWTEFRVANRPGIGYWDPEPPVSRDEATTWRVWMKEVFMPLNIQMVDAAVQKADLLEESTMPECLLDLCAHVAAYRSVRARWEQGDYSEHTSLMRFPEIALRDYAETRFLRLKSEQRRLLEAGW